MVNPQSFCIFCDNSDLSKEHIMPQWLQAIAGASSDETNYVTRQYIEGFHGLPPRRAQYQKTRSGDFLTRKARVVCRQCNNGWMGRLEEKVKPVVSALVLGEHRVLCVEDQADLAAWICLKTIVMEFFQVKHSDRPLQIAIHEEDRKYLRIHRRPPDNWRIVLAHNRGVKWNSHYGHFRIPLVFGNVVLASGEVMHVPMAAAGRPNTQSTTFGLGSMVFYNISTSLKWLKTYSKGDEKAHGLFTIWPSNMELLVWPTSPALTDKAIDELAVSIEHKLRGIGALVPRSGFGT